MAIKDRLERVAVVLTSTEFSPSGELREMEEFRPLSPPSPVSRICRESAERVHRIMGRGGAA